MGLCSDGRGSDRSGRYGVGARNDREWAVINEILDNIQHRFTDAIDFITNPLWRWYFLLALFILVASIIVYFLGWVRFVKEIVGTAVVLAIAYVAGGRAMYYETKEERERDLARVKKQQEVAERERPKNGGWFPFS